MVDQIHQQAQAQNQAHHDTNYFSHAQIFFHLVQDLFSGGQCRLFFYWFRLAVGSLPALGAVATDMFYRFICATTGPALPTIGTKGRPVGKSIAIPTIVVTKDGGYVLAIFFRIRRRHDALFCITLAPIKDDVAFGRSFLDTGASVVAGVAVSPAGNQLDLALQPGVTHGAGAVHSVLAARALWFIFKSGECREIVVITLACVGSETSVAVAADAFVVAKQIAVPVVCRCRSRAYHANVDVKHEHLHEQQSQGW